MSARDAVQRRPRLASQARLTWDPVREKHVLLGPEGVLVLNGTSSAILTLCDGRRSVDEIAAELGRQYNHVAGGEVATFLERLVSRRLVEFADGA